MILSQTLNALEKRNPELTKIIENTPITNRYKLVKSQRVDGTNTLLDMRGNKNFYDNINPIAFAQREIIAKKVRLPNCTIFLGFGLGYHIVEYLQKFPKAIIIIVEPDPEILKIAFSDNSFVNYKHLLSQQNVFLLGAVDPYVMYPKIHETLNLYCLHYLKSMNIFELQASVSVNKDYYVRFMKTLQEAVKNVFTLYGNCPEDSLVGIRTTLQNIPTIINNPGIIDLKDKFKGKPGIVVSTGPSLNKNVHLLQGLRDKAVMCAADASARALKKHGVNQAHFVTALERVLETSYLFNGLTSEDLEGCYLAAVPVVVPETYANYNGEKVIVYRKFATFEWLDINKGTLEIGPSAGNMAFKVLEYLGCDPIILVGQDLAYGEGDISHASGGEYVEDDYFIKNYGGDYVEGNYVDKIKTMGIWKLFLKDYEINVSKTKAKVINATEGGAKIHGTEIMTLAEALDKYIKDDINTLDNIKANLKPVPYKIKISQANSVVKKTKSAIEYCDKLIAEFKVGVEECDKYGKIIYTHQYVEDITETEELSEIFEKIKKPSFIFSEREFYLILMHYVQSFLINALNDLNSLIANNDASLTLDIKMMYQYKKIYSTHVGLLEIIKKEFEELLISLNKYKEELGSENN